MGQRRPSGEQLRAHLAGGDQHDLGAPTAGETVLQVQRGCVPSGRDGRAIDPHDVDHLVGKRTGLFGDQIVGAARANTTNTDGGSY